MKTVWLLTAGSYSDFHVVGVFSSKENAELARKKLNKKGDDYGDEPEEVVIDPGVEQMRAGLSLYFVGMNYEGCVDMVQEWESDLKEDDHYHIHRGRITTTVWSDSPAGAVKAVNEKRLALIASGEFQPGPRRPSPDTPSNMQF